MAEGIAIRKITIRMMQNQSITIQLSKREKIRNQFLRQAGEVAEDMAPMGLVDSLKGKLVQAIKEKAEWKGRALKLTEEAAGHKSREAKYKQLIALLKAERTSGPAAAPSCGSGATACCGAGCGGATRRS